MESNVPGEEEGKGGEGWAVIQLVGSKSLELDDPAEHFA